MDRKMLIAGNWKMYTTSGEGAVLIQDLADRVREVWDDVEVAVCPPFTGLKAASTRDRARQAHHRARRAGHALGGRGRLHRRHRAADAHGARCDYVIIGHSERREFFGETNETVNRKVQAAFAARASCRSCAAARASRSATRSRPSRSCASRCSRALRVWTRTQAAKLVIAYEPIWAIGTGRTPTPEAANDVCRTIRATVGAMYGPPAAMAVRVLYGGSVKAENAKMFFAEPDIDGGLVGGAALKADSFADIVKARRAVRWRSSGPPGRARHHGRLRHGRARSGQRHLARAHAQPRRAFRRVPLDDAAARRSCRGPSRGPDGQLRGRPPEHGRRARGLPGAHAHQPRDRGRVAPRQPVLAEAIDAAVAARRCGALHGARLRRRRTQPLRSTSTRWSRMAAARGATRVFVHAFLDGRDVPPSSGLEYVRALESVLAELGVGRVATVHGPLLRDGPRQPLGARGAGVARHGARRGRAGRSRAASRSRRRYAAGVTDEFVVPSVVTADGGPAVRGRRRRSSSSTSGPTAPARSPVRSSTRPSTGFERPAVPDAAVRVPHRVRPDHPRAGRVPQGPAVLRARRRARRARACASSTSPRPRSTRT